MAVLDFFGPAQSASGYCLPRVPGQTPTTVFYVGQPTMAVFASAGPTTNKGCPRFSKQNHKISATESDRTHHFQAQI